MCVLLINYVVFVSLSVSKFMCDVFYVEFYLENVWYRSFFFVCERCLILSSYSGVIQTLTVLHKRLTRSILAIACLTYGTSGYMSQRMCY